MYRDGEISLHKGYDYEKEGLVKRFVSNRMMMNPMMESFLLKLDPYFKELLNSVKKIQFYFNYTVDKNDTTLNK
jgi:hypothetical protein